MIYVMIYVLRCVCCFLFEQVLRCYFLNSEDGGIPGDLGVDYGDPCVRGSFSDRVDSSVEFGSMCSVLVPPLSDWYDEASCVEDLVVRQYHQRVLRLLKPDVTRVLSFARDILGGNTVVSPGLVGIVFSVPDVLVRGERSLMFLQCLLLSDVRQVCDVSVRVFRFAVFLDRLFGFGSDRHMACMMVLLYLTRPLAMLEANLVFRRSVSRVIYDICVSWHVDFVFPEGSLEFLYHSAGFEYVVRHAYFRMCLYEETSRWQYCSDVGYPLAAECCEWWSSDWPLQEAAVAPLPTPPPPPVAGAAGHDDETVISVNKKG